MVVAMQKPIILIFCFQTILLKFQPMTPFRGRKVKHLPVLEKFWRQTASVFYRELSVQ